MPRAPHNRVDAPANQPTPVSPIETMLSLLPLGKGEDVFGTGILVSPRRSPFFNIPWESQVSEIRWNFISHVLVGEVMRLVSEGRIVMSIKMVLVSLKIPSCHLELTSKNAVLMFSAPKPVGKHEFSDILNAQGFKSATGQDTGPQTLKSLKKEKNKSDDPIKAKVIF